ncbi:hypothetical protein FB446DRAFT_336786 [Lentinula raphanica]|nr:hypothetical protein FB446DRAFT_336786 [Lentinula raphanica]
MSVAEVVDNSTAVIDEGSTPETSTLLSEPMHEEGNHLLNNIKDESNDASELDTLETAGLSENLEGVKNEINGPVADIRELVNGQQENLNTDEESESRRELVETDQAPSQGPESHAGLLESPSLITDDVVKVVDASSLDEEDVGRSLTGAGSDTQTENAIATSLDGAGELPLENGMESLIVKPASNVADTTLEPSLVGQSTPEGSTENTVTAVAEGSDLEVLRIEKSSPVADNVLVADAAIPVETEIHEDVGFSTAEEGKEMPSKHEDSGGHIPQSTTINMLEASADALPETSVDAKREGADGGPADEGQVHSIEGDVAIVHNTEAKETGEASRVTGEYDIAGDGPIELPANTLEPSFTGSTVGDEQVGLHSSAVPDPVTNSEHSEAHQIEIEHLSDPSSIPVSDGTNLIMEEASSENADSSNIGEVSEPSDQQSTGAEVITNIEAVNADDGSPAIQDGGAQSSEASTAESAPSPESTIDSKEIDPVDEGVQETSPDAIMNSEEFKSEPSSSPNNVQSVEVIPAPDLVVEQSSVVEGISMIDSGKHQEDPEIADNIHVPATVVGDHIDTQDGLASLDADLEVAQLSDVPVENPEIADGLPAPATVVEDHIDAAHDELATPDADLEVAQSSDVPVEGASIINSEKHLEENPGIADELPAPVTLVDDHIDAAPDELVNPDVDLEVAIKDQQLLPEAAQEVLPDEAVKLEQEKVQPEGSPSIDNIENIKYYSAPDLVAEQSAALPSEGASSIASEKQLEETPQMAGETQVPSTAVEGQLEPQDEPVDPDTYADIPPQVVNRDHQLLSEEALEALPDEQDKPVQDQSEARPNLDVVGESETNPVVELTVEKSSTVPTADIMIVSNTQIEASVTSADDVEGAPTLGGELGASKDDPSNPPDSPVVEGLQDDSNLTVISENNLVGLEEPVSHPDNAGLVEVANVSVERYQKEDPAIEGSDVQPVSHDLSEEAVLPAETSPTVIAERPTGNVVEEESLEAPQALRDTIDSSVLQAAGADLGNSSLPVQSGLHEKPLSMIQEPRLINEGLDITLTGQNEAAKATDNNDLEVDREAVGIDESSAEPLAPQPMTLETLDNSLAITGDLELPKDPEIPPAAVSPVSAADLHTKDVLDMEPVADINHSDVSNLGAEVSDIEVPKSPWTPSYSVTNQGPDMTVEEDTSDVDLASSDMPAGAEPPVLIVDTVHDQVKPSAEKPEATETPSRPSSPWVPSYSVSVQGSPAVSAHNSPVIAAVDIPANDVLVFEDDPSISEVERDVGVNPSNQLVSDQTTPSSDSELNQVHAESITEVMEESASGAQLEDRDERVDQIAVNEKGLVELDAPVVDHVEALPETEVAFTSDLIKDEAQIILDTEGSADSVISSIADAEENHDGGDTSNHVINAVDLERPESSWNVSPLDVPLQEQNPNTESASINVIVTDLESSVPEVHTLADVSKATIPEESKDHSRPSSPWVPSYSVSVQGSPSVSVHTSPVIAPAVLAESESSESSVRETLTVPPDETVVPNVIHESKEEHSVGSLVPEDSNVVPVQSVTPSEVNYEPNETITESTSPGQDNLDALTVTVDEESQREQEAEQYDGMQETVC